jgi:DNA-directed RNA polymerase subunit omega
MARITVEDCLEKVDNQYDLVLMAKERTTQLNSGSPMLVEEDNDKKTIIALREIGDGKVSVEELEKNAVLRLRKEPDQVEQLEETEEEINDDFENLYKGQVSKTGVAVLPSKRTRRIPEIKTAKLEESNLAKEALNELKEEQPEIKEENLESKDIVEEPKDNLEETSEPLELNKEASEENK